MTEPKYPEIEVQLSGEDGNAFNVLGKVHRAMEKNGVPQNERTQFMRLAMASDYENLLRVCAKWVSVS